MYAKHLNPYMVINPNFFHLHLLRKWIPLPRIELHISPNNQKTVSKGLVLCLGLYIFVYHCIASSLPSSKTQIIYDAQLFHTARILCKKCSWLNHFYVLEFFFMKNRVISPVILAFVYQSMDVAHVRLKFHNCTTWV